MSDDTLLLCKLIEDAEVSEIAKLIDTRPEMVNEKGKYEIYPLDYSIQYDRPEVVVCLITKQAVINYITTELYTYLHDAVESKGKNSEKILQILLEHNANKEVGGLNGWTPLHMSAALGYVNKMKLLIKYGCNLNSRTVIDENDTPLMVAVYWGHVDAVKTLIESCCDINLKDTMGKSALDIAISRYSENGKKCFKEIINQLELPVT